MAPSSYILADKPAGILTHSGTTEKPGFCEWLEKKLTLELNCLHTLDKETTGCLLLASRGHEKIHITQHKFLFITDRVPTLQKWSMEQTHFRVIKSHDIFSLIEATTHNGKNDALRLQAKNSHVPLFGDLTYGGTPFFTFFLHSLSVKLNEGVSHSASPPLIYENLELLTRPLLCQWLMSFDRRQRLYPELFAGEQCLRLIHNEGTPLRIDKLGNTLHAGWWSEQPPSENEQRDISTLLDLLGFQYSFLQVYRKQKTQDANIIANSALPVWTAQENKALFEFKHEVGSSPGLFLDQRNQRRWVKENSYGKNVLNLFSYTGGFSVMAALGGASSVVTVDLSKKYVEWSKENFRLNHLQPELFKFYDMDSVEYLKYAAKKNQLFDIIICDPPSFSRNKNKTFQIDRDFKLLIEKMLPILSATGVILFSTNFEQWDARTWERALESVCRPENLEFTSNFSWQWDFEMDPKSTQMKAFQIKKVVFA